MALYRWNITQPNNAAVEALMRDMDIGRLAALTLCARGHETARAAGDFLRADTQFEDSFCMRDMQRAVERITLAIEEGERIAVFGDYDVDGVTATALLVQYLQSSGADAVCSLPSRESSGYGLSKTAVDNLKKYDVSLIVTVDNGISAYDEIAYARSMGIDVVVCDHHLPPARLPDAVAVVDPLRSDDESTYKDLAGVGVALKLAAAIEGCGVVEILEMYGHLAAVGTIADIMPLKGENRAIVQAGLEQLREGANPGLAALCAACEQSPETLDARKVAFTVAPRLNAAGRMDSADVALQLLLCEDEEEAAAIAARLLELNTKRREAEQQASAAIAQLIGDAPDLLKRPVLVLAAEGLHAGVTGIVCSRMVERYGKPTVIISLEGGEAKGSGRSVPGFSLHEAITSCSSVLQKFGGHEMAAGFTLRTEDVPAFTELLQEYGAAHGALQPCLALAVDAEVAISDIDERAVQELSALEPFGSGNEEPVFCATGLEVSDVVSMGEGHSRVTLRRDGKSLTGAVFGRAPGMLPFAVGDAVDAAFVLSIYNTPYKSMVSVRFRDIRPSGLGEEEFNSVAAYERLCAGLPLAEAQQALLALAREQVVGVFRALRGAPVDRSDYSDLAFRFAGLLPGRAAAILDVLEQLKLVQVIALPSGALMVSPIEGAAKRDLMESPLFAALNREVTV